MKAIEANATHRKGFFSGRGPFRSASVLGRAQFAGVRRSRAQNARQAVFRAPPAARRRVAFGVRVDDDAVWTTV